MTPTEIPATVAGATNEMSAAPNEVALRLAQLEAEQSAAEKEIKMLRLLLESLIEHRQKSHGELIILLTNLVSKLPINEVGVIVARLMEHNTQVTEYLSALLKGKPGESLPAPPTLKLFEQTKQNLLAAVKPAVEELIRLDTPLENEMLQSLIPKPDLFFSPTVARANRCFNKGQLPRERVVREFGEEALIFFNDLTTDPKLNPRPKMEEIVLAFKYDFEPLFQKNQILSPEKRQALQTLHQKVQRSKGAKAEARAQKIVFAKLSFLIELLHYYENQSSEAPEGIFAQRLPGLVEQFVVPDSQDELNEDSVARAEALLAFIINPDHRHMVVNNIGKNGGVARSLKFVLKLRAEKVTELDLLMHEFVRHLITVSPSLPARAAVLRLIKPEMQRAFLQAINASDKLTREEAGNLDKLLRKELELPEIEIRPPTISPEVERQIAWEGIKELIAQRSDPAAIATAIRDRLHAKYDADELKQSWLVLIEADVMTFIRTFCQLPYLPDGKTDAIAQTVMETYVTRLTHEKYAAAYNKVVNSLKNMFKANPASPTLLNFMTLVKWVDPDAAKKLSGEIGMPVAQ